MPYATRLDLLEKVNGPQELSQVATRSNAAPVDPAVLERVLKGEDTSGDPPTQVALAEEAKATIDAELDRASRRMDMRLRVRYSLPFAEPVPPELLGLCLDIARYFLHDVNAPAEVRKRFDDAMAELAAIAEGESDVTVPPGGTTTTAASPLVSEGWSRQYTEDTLRPYGCGMLGADRRAR